eukprot:1056390-Rhodomonas_salina.1
MSGTGIACCAIPLWTTSICPHVTCGTELAYAAMRCAVLRLRMLLCGVRYRASVCCYAVCGTGRAYAAAHMLRDLRTELGYAATGFYKAARADADRS